MEMCLKLWETLSPAMFTRRIEESRLNFRFIDRGRFHLKNNFIFQSIDIILLTFISYSNASFGYKFSYPSVLGVDSFGSDTYWRGLKVCSEMVLN